MIRIATDRACWRDDLPVAPMLQPLLGEFDATAGGTAWDRRFERYAAVAETLFEVTSVAHADVVVLPGDWYWVRGTSWLKGPDRELTARVRPLYERAIEAGKPVVMFFSGDRSCDRVPFPDAHVFRQGELGSRLGPRDHPMPAFPEDLAEFYCQGSLVERTWRPRPTIGFCGLAKPKAAWRRAAGLALYQPVIGARERRIDPSPYLGEVLRSRAVRLLQQCRDVDTNFVLRDSKVFFRDADTRDLVGVRREYVDNMVESDYILCVRGSGNYSYRLYEALCMGRVPVIVNTDLAMPVREDVEWEQLTVWVDRHEIATLPDRIMAFHADLTPSRFVELQHALRQLWLERLAPESYFARISDLGLTGLR